jgi:hypothetical protein
VAVYCWSSFLPEEVWENWAQGVCNAQHDLCEAAGQHAQQVAVLWLVLVHAAKVVVKASLENSRRMQGGKTRSSTRQWRVHTAWQTTEPQDG